MQDRFAVATDGWPNQALTPARPLRRGAIMSLRQRRAQGEPPLPSLPTTEVVGDASATVVRLRTRSSSHAALLRSARPLPSRSSTPPAAGAASRRRCAGDRPGTAVAAPTSAELGGSRSLVGHPSPSSLHRARWLEACHWSPTELVGSGPAITTGHPQSSMARGPPLVVPPPRAARFVRRAPS